MIEALLTAYESGDDPDEISPVVWGMCQWVVLPKPGDTVGFTFDHDFRWLTVMEIKHFPCDPEAEHNQPPHPPPRGPQIHVVCRAGV